MHSRQMHNRQMHNRFSASLCLLLFAAPGSVVSQSTDNLELAYPAPPGIYGYPELLEEVGLLNDANDTMAAPAADLDPAVVPPPPEPVATSAETTAADQPEVTEALLPPPLLRAPLANQAPNQASTHPPTQSLNQSPNLSPNLPLAQSPTHTPALPMNYPSARQLMERMQAAGNLAFDQWGVPLQERTNPPVYRSPTDYGYAQVPIVERAPYPTRQPRGMPQNQPPSLADYSGNYAADHRRYPVPGDNYAGQYDPRIDRQPSYPAYLPGAAPSYFDNSQYMFRVPEEEIIYPPSWPGRR